MKQLSLLEYARLREPTRSDREHIERIAADTIAELEEHAPIDLDVVASYRGINEIRLVPLPVSGCLAPAAGKITMLLNSAESRRRRRFTGFHEVGHSFQPGYLIRTQYRCNPRTRSSRATDPETLADIAAASLLLPEGEFCPDVHESDFGLTAIMDLAEHYDASIQASAYRYQRYWPEPTLVMVLAQGLRKEERKKPDAETKLRVVSVHALGNWPFIPTNKSAALDGCLTRADLGELVDEPTTLAELGVKSPPGLEVSARALSYRAADGEPNRRVLALYRQIGRRRREQHG